MSLELRIIKDPCRQVFKPRTRAFGQHGGDIGRAPDSYWVLPDPKGYVSSRHCTVEFKTGGFWLRDNSRNGVYVNGSRQAIGRGNLVPLQHGDRLRVAEYELLVRVMDRPELPDPDHAPMLNGNAPEASAALAGAMTNTGEHAEFEPGQTAMIDTRALASLGFPGETETTHIPDEVAEQAWAGRTDAAGSTHPSLETPAEDAGEDPAPERNWPRPVRSSSRPSTASATPLRGEGRASRPRGSRHAT
jgi:type VI secretion system FHA domain protein